MTTFALVHGAHHGAWCWEKLIPDLEARGAAAVAVDLPCEDATAGAVRYAEIAAGALAGVQDDVVLVGHSLAGITIPLVAGTRPVAQLVYLAAALPKPGVSFAQQVAEEGVLARGALARGVHHEDG